MSKKTLNESQVLRFKMLSGVDTLAEEKIREMHCGPEEKLQSLILLILTRMATKKNP